MTETNVNTYYMEANQPTMHTQACAWGVGWLPHCQSPHCVGFSDSSRSLSKVGHPRDSVCFC